MVQLFQPDYQPFSTCSDHTERIHQVFRDRHVQLFEQLLFFDRLIEDVRGRDISQRKHQALLSVKDDLLAPDVDPFLFC